MDGPKSDECSGKELWMPKTNALTLILSRCGLPTKQTEWDTWYDDVHLPDLVNSGAFWTASRWTVTNSNQLIYPRLGFTHLTLGEIDAEDLEASEETLAALEPEWRISGRLHPNHFVDDMVTLKPFGRWSDKGEPSPDTRGLWVIFNRCNDPAKVDEWHEWLDDVHLPECLELSGFHGVSRWIRVRPEPHLPSYCVIYDVRDASMDEGIQRIVDLNRSWEAEGKIPDYHAGSLGFVIEPTDRWGAAGYSRP